MEVKGQETDKSYHTIHYGYSSGSGHKENQGSKTLSEGTFADEFHVYRVDWDPGKITWYVDDEEVYSTSDWYTGTDDDNQITYPAPFDQDFYIILNLAVGGSWVGYPNDDVYADMNNQTYEVDYVRVYQKSAKEYERLEAECKRPEKEEVKAREADENGNYVINGDFSKDIHLDGVADAKKDNWKLHLENDAKGTTYEIKDNEIRLVPDAAGSQNHSVQLKQEGIPMYKGWEYELTFDAVADEDRTIIVDVESPDRGWTRILQDTTLNVGTTKQSYSYTFTMNDKNDLNGSLEFNLGNQGSTAPVTISNVKLTHKSGDEIPEDNSKVIRPDGNYVYNGSFDQGEKRLGYWEISEEDAQYVSVTNASGKRELKVNVPEGRVITVKQSALSPIGQGEYELSFNARTDGGAQDGLTVDVAGKSFTPELTDSDAKFSKKLGFDLDRTRDESNVTITFSQAGTYYLDNVFFCESALIKNGSFNAGLSGFTPYIYDTVKATYVVDNMKFDDNVFAITIEDTMADDAGNSWYVQLNQDGVTLEQGKSYRLSFKARSSIDRVISYAMQEFEGEWTNYSKTGSVQIGDEWKTFTADFTMDNPTDTNTRFNITMGSVDGIRITEKHDVYIDDISLIEIDEPENPGTEEPGTEEPGTEQPGTTEPGTEEPGTTEPGTEEPGTVEPGTEEPGDEPVIDNPTDDPTDDPAVEPGTEDPTDDPTDEPEVVPPTPKPVPVIVPIVRVVRQVVKTVVSVLRWLFR
jgi:hypothetical protein